MKRIHYLAMVCCAVAGMATAQSTFYIESRDSSGAITNSTLFEEQGGWYGPGSTLKSNAPAPELPGGVLQGAGSEWSTNTTIDAVVLWKIGNHASFVAGTAYNIYVTTGVSSSVDAANSTFVVYDNAHPEGSPLDSGVVPLVGTTAGTDTGNTWYKVAENVTLGAGAVLKVAEAAPQADRFYADAIKIEPYTTGPTPTPTPTPTPWPTPKPVSQSAVQVAVIDDVGSDNFNANDGFACYPIEAATGLLPWYQTTANGYEGDMWYRDARAISTNPDDATATATWTFANVPADIYDVAYYIVDSPDYFDNCYYGIRCATTSVNTVVVASQNRTGGVFCYLAEGVPLEGTVVVTSYNIGRGGQTLGTQMRADAMALYQPPILNARSWQLYQ